MSSRVFYNSKQKSQQHSVEVLLAEKEVGDHWTKWMSRMKKRGEKEDRLYYHQQLSEEMASIIGLVMTELQDVAEFQDVKASQQLSAQSVQACTRKYTCALNQPEIVL